MESAFTNSKLSSLMVFVALIFVSFSSFGSAENDGADATKTGWKLGGVLPTITFNSDLGLQYGALVNFFDYGDGTRFPRYDHSLYFEVSRYTKGSGVNRFFYDSDRLINGIRTTFDLTYMTDPLMCFFGFNGYQSVYDESLTIPDSEAYISRAFYKFDRKLFRTKLDLQGRIGDGKMSWVSGFETYNYAVGSVDVDKLNKNKTKDLLPDVPGLYDKYVDWGLIAPDEKDGGWVNYVKAGIAYDTRDQEAHPMKGIWTEAVALIAPGFLTSGDFGHARISFSHRQYFTLVPENLSFAYRINMQQNIFGNPPFYVQSLVITSFLRSYASEGLGGSRTIRGVLRNRIVGNGYALGNIELRWKFMHFNIGATNVYLGLNGFFDAGVITDKIKLDMDNVPIAERQMFFDENAGALHLSAGTGLKVAINRNFVVSMDYGMAFDKRDGDTGLYVELNYLF